MQSDCYPKCDGIEQVKKIKHASVQTIKTGVYEGGFQIWEGGDDLYNYIAHHIELFKGKKVLEVGCGQALPSVLLKKHGIEVDVADYNSDVLELTKLNFQVNELDISNVKFISGDWDLIVEGRYDYIIGGDVTYNPEYQPKLAHLLSRLLKEDGKAIIAAKVVYIGNGGRIVDFFELMKQQGFDYHYEQVSHSGVVRLIVTFTRRS
ncbi:hypothetical protein ENUP19_0047G0132 [Entamoeba nuttalli]|uniref:protein-histidine N-methyltransferase n=3 Tax=Entamoeba TaxID=5758 RepID=M2RI58_ENTHI|nr:methyltransferase domain containing protein [Entamoeba nuttalli P19]EKE38203.1 methyltransferase domain containing protein [Entamoeba nuttalli P19]EMD49283.1 methyltransferase domain containing protein [Entamoeba histolytica KU27]|eukprot:XP_008859471.1 methyltransferase domain containing protein [Entamoeba nuttalli P19]